MIKGALFSPCRTYRYALWRIWNMPLKPLCVIGLNPSTADECRDDPTIRRCLWYASDWGFGGLFMGNIFAYRATDPKVMKRVKEPVGWENDFWLRTLSQASGLTLGAWGNHGTWLNRSQEVSALLPEVHCLKVTAQGQPIHPLYQPNNLTPILYVRNGALAQILTHEERTDHVIPRNPRDDY